MALVSALLSALLRRLGTLVQTLFGWSVTALFGKLSRAQQLAISATLVLSAIWPLTLVSVVFPSVGGWVIAFLPLQKWLSDSTLRIVWVGLAVLIPPLVGALTRFAAETRSLRGGVLQSALAGFPLTVGYFCAFVITVVTVPLSKLSAIARRWSDDHVYIRAKPGEYDRAFHGVAEAFVLAGFVPRSEPVPTRLSLASKAVKWFAQKAVQPTTPEEPRRLVAPGIEAYLYPADLLLRGEPRRLSRVRAMLSRTSIDQAAYLVSSPGAQKVQDELGRVWEMLARHERPDEVRAMAERRLREIYHELNAIELAYAEWVLLEGLARRVERAIGEGPKILDSEQDGLEKATQAAAASEEMLRLNEKGNSSHEFV